VAMLTEHKNDPRYLSEDERGRQLPGFLEAVAELLSSEQAALLEEMGSLANNVEHIKQIVAVQQSHAKHAEMAEEVNIVTLTEDAIRVCGASLERAGIQVVREMTFVSTAFTDKHALMQILINLISNAKQAVLENPPGGRRIILRAGAVQRGQEAWLRLDVIDNGVGISAENMGRVFHHGFTTKKDGHGFGLHASANSARQAGGSLTAHSDGPGRGATFTLQLPLKTESVRA
jgi:signal transduction histidine kinase